MTDDQQELRELIDFLSSPRLEVREGAVGLAEGLTATLEGLDKLMSEAGALLPALLRLLGAERDTSRAALTALINLCQACDLPPREEAIKRLLDLKAIGRVMDYLRGGGSAHAGLLVMLLSNLTVSEAGSEQLLQLGSAALAGFNVAVLLERFLEEEGPTAKEDPYEHVALILTNITRLPGGRRLLLAPGRRTLAALACQLAPGRSRMRRSGCASALRNCCFRAEEDGTLEALLADTAALGDVLEALCGTTRAREAEPDVRNCLAESVEMLVSTERGKEALWQLKAAEMLQKAYETEEDPEVCASMERTAGIFMAEGGPGEELQEHAQAPVAVS